MKGYKVVPSSIRRSRKIQLKQFESEEMTIEYSIQINDEGTIEQALQDATDQANRYLDKEERRLRKIIAIYSIEVSEEGQVLGGLHIKTSDDKQFENFIHVWKTDGADELYVGYLHRLSGEFKFKEENKEKIDALGISIEKHFNITSD